MLGKFEILFVILLLLLSFYCVIRLGARKRGEGKRSDQISSYIRSINFLLILMVVVAIVLWSFIN